MKAFLDELRALFTGEIEINDASRTLYSHDASMYELVPKAILYPHGSKDISHLIRLINAQKSTYPTLAITPRGAGTNTSGGAIGTSLILDLSKHFTATEHISASLIRTQSGVPMSALVPQAATRYINSTIGGAIATHLDDKQSIKELKVILADSDEYTIKPLTRRELTVKMAKNTYEGILYRRVYELIEKNYDLIKNARPKTIRNSTGYNLWHVWDRETGIFDLTQLFVGSQGTLGIITDVTLVPIPQKKQSGTLFVYLHTLKHLEKIITLVTSHEPASFEGYDDTTFSSGIRHGKHLRSQLGTKTWLKQQTILLSSTVQSKSTLPGILFVIQFEGNTYHEVNDKIIALQSDLRATHPQIQTEIKGNEVQSPPFWDKHRARLERLQQVDGRNNVRFLDDMAVPVRSISAFLPRLRHLIDTYQLPVTVTGRYDSGTFHLVPLFKKYDQALTTRLELALHDLVPVIVEYGGTLAGENNDGIVRGPWLPAIFGHDIYELFKDVKELFDPNYIFNPHKKTDASWKFGMQHIRDNRDD